MTARSTSSATVSFGLVSIPVKLYPATSPQSQISFNLLHKKCGSRLKQQYICPVDEEIVPRDEMSKGYEFAKDQYVQFSPEELKALEERPTQTIDITEFIPLSSIDPVYFDKPYYLGPDRGGDKAYTLLTEAMRRTGRAALAKYAARGKQYLVLLRPSDRGMVMQQLLYAGEVRPFSEVPLGNADVRDAELELALRFIEQLSSDTFKPDTYEDEVRKRTLELIERKVAGQEISVAPAEPERAQVIDLVEALKASLAREGQTPRAPAKAPAAEPEAEKTRKPARRAPRAQTPARKTEKK